MSKKKRVQIDMSTEEVAILEKVKRVNHHKTTNDAIIGSLTRVLLFDQFTQDGYRLMKKEEDGYRIIEFVS